MYPEAEGSPVRPFMASEAFLTVSGGPGCLVFLCGLCAR